MSDLEKLKKQVKAMLDQLEEVEASESKEVTTMKPILVAKGITESASGLFKSFKKKIDNLATKGMEREVRQTTNRLMKANKTMREIMEQEGISEKEMQEIIRAYEANKKQQPENNKKNSESIIIIQ